MLGCTVLPSGEQDAIAPEFGVNEVGGAGGLVKPSGFVECRCGLGEALDRHGVPSGQYLVIEAGALPLGPFVEELLLGARQQRRSLVRLKGQPLNHRAPGITAVQVPVALEIGGLVDAIKGGHHQILVFAQQALDAFPAPHIELALLTLRVGVQCRVEGAVRMAHLPQQPADCLPHRALEKGIGANGQRIGVQGQQLAVVVKHLLEVRDHPRPVGGVAAEAAAEMVVDAASGHLGEGGHDHVEGLALPLARLLGVGPMAQHPVQRGGHGKLRRPAKAAFLLIVLLTQLPPGGGQQILVA